MTKHQREQQRRAREKRKRQEERTVRRAAMLAEAAILGVLRSPTDYNYQSVGVTNSPYRPAHRVPRHIPTRQLRARLRNVRR